MKKCISSLAAILIFCLLTLGAGAASGGVSVTVQDGAWADYGVTIPFTRSSRATDYTFSLFAGGTAAGSPVVRAKVEMADLQGDVYLPLAYDTTGPQSYTLKIEAHPLASRAGLDKASVKEFSFTTAPTCGCAAGTAGAFYRGTGSTGDPFYVGTPGQLRHLERHSAASFYQDREIALSGNWTPIPSFSGTYDGGGHKITGLSIGGVQDAGLFTSLSGSTVKNLCVQTAGVVSGTGTAGIVAAAMDRSTLSRCCAVGQVQNTASDGYPGSGGLVGSAKTSTLEDCYFAGTIQSVTGAPIIRWVGGIASVLNNGCTVQRCYSFAEYQTGSASYITSAYSVGGIAGTIASLEGNGLIPGTVNSASNYWLASGTGSPSYGYANVCNYPSGPSSDAGCTRLSSFSSLPAGFDSSVWEMGSVTIPTLSGGSKTVAAPVLKAFQP